MKKTIRLYLRASSALMALAAAMAAPTLNPPVFRVISQMHRYAQPLGITESAAGEFYFAGGGQIVSITPKGAVVPATALQSPPNIIESPPITAANQRVYSAVESNRGANTAHAFSVEGISGERAYAEQGFSQTFAQNLPDGSLLTLAYRFSDASMYLAKTDLEGNVLDPIYRFAAGDQPGTYDNALYAADGNYYGAAMTAAKDQTYVYRITPGGSLTKLLQLPRPVAAYILEGHDGDLYGIAGADRSESASIFKLALDGTYTPLHTFPARDSGPAMLIEASDGKLYGASDGPGGSYLFSLTPAGQYDVIYQMKTNDGRCPCTLVQASNGAIFGTAQTFGISGGGTVFALDAGLPKPAPQVRAVYPDSAPAGARVRIWGRNLLGAEVQFNGKAAAAAYSSGPNYVWATVPTGATSGPVTISTPGGKAAGHKMFTVK